MLAEKKSHLLYSHSIPMIIAKKMLKGKIAESFIGGGHQGENENVPVLRIFSLQS